LGRNVVADHEEWIGGLSDLWIVEEGAVFWFETSLNRFERCLAEIQAGSFIQGVRFQCSGILFFGLTRLDWA